VRIKKEEFLYPVWEKVEKNLHQEIPLNELAFFSTYSPWHFHRMFARFQSENVKDYIRRLRIEKAAFELRVTNFPILEIAMEAGYTSQEAFTKAFRRTLGTTPSQFRKKFSKTKKAMLLDQSLREMGIEKDDLFLRKTSPFILLYRRKIGSYQEMPGFPEDPGFLFPFQTWLDANDLDWHSQKWIGISQDDPDITESSKIRFDFGTPFPPNRTVPKDLGIQKVEGCDRLQIRVRVPYEKLPQVYKILLEEFFPKYPRKLANLPPFEVYVTREPKSAPITDLYFALR